MLIDVCATDRKWYRVISKPKTKTKNIVKLSFCELGLSHYKPTISVVLGNDSLLLELNTKYRKIEKPTNVLSFCYEEISQGGCIGEIFISVDRIIQESFEFDRSFEQHFSHMLVHGVLQKRKTMF